MVCMTCAVSMCFVLQDFTFFFNHNVAYAAFQQCITEEHHQGLLSSPNYYLIPPRTDLGHNPQTHRVVFRAFLA